MSSPSPKLPRFIAQLASRAWWLLLLLALAALWLATERRVDRVEALTTMPTWSTPAPERDADSPTGLEGGQRSLIVPGHHNPTYWWIMEAQKAAADGALRLRQIDYDMAPEGREIRRTAPYRWWLTTVGWAGAAVSGEPLGYAIERGALYADPLLLALLLVVGAAYAARYIGAFAAVGFVIGGISLFPLAANFQPGAPDPHSLAWVLAVGSALPLLGMSRDGGRRGHFILAGVLGGIGLWNDATTQAPVLLAVFLGGLAYELVRVRGGAQPAGTPWRAWAAAGALVALAASLFEFAPDHFSWSLDAVSPVHAVVWLGFGEALRAAGLWARAGRQGFGRRDLTALALAALAIACWPVVGIATDSGGLLAADFYARTLANHPDAGVAPSLGAWLSRPGDSGAKWATLLPCALLVVVLARLVLGKGEPEARARLAFVFVALLLAVALAFNQLRWWNLVDALALVLLAALFAEAAPRGGRARWASVGAAALALPGLFLGFPSPAGEVALDELEPLERQAFVERDFGYWLAKRRDAEEPIVLFSTPIFSGGAAYYGGFKSAGSSDTSDQAGMMTAVRIASATSAQEASILLNARGVTHVALPLWDPTLEQLARIGFNQPPGQPLPQEAFSVSLEAWDPPLWMRHMNYWIPDEPGLQGYDLRAFAVQAEQEPELALSRLADLFVERGLLREAETLRGVLEDYPRSVAALAAVANIDFALRDRERLEQSLEAVIPFLSRRAARDLPVDRRVSLAALFLQTQRVELAKEQLGAAFEDLDAEALRRMTPGKVTLIVALSRTLRIPFPSEELEEVALDLIPPRIRDRLEKA